MKSTIAKDSLKLTGSKVVMMMISMITAMLLSRYRTLEEYGTYSQLLMVINLTISLFVLGLPNSSNYFLARTDIKSERQRFLSVFFSLSNALSLLIGVVLLLLAPKIVNYFNNPLIEDFVFVLAIYPWNRIILSTIDQILIIYHKMDKLIVFRVVNSIFLLLLIVVVKLMNWSFFVYMALFVAGESVFTLVALYIVKGLEKRLTLDFDKKTIIEILKFSIPLGLATAVGTFHIEFDKLFISVLLSTEEVALYTNASREMPVSIIVTSITAVLMPKLVRMLNKNKHDDAVHLWGESITLAYSIIAVIVSGLIVYAPEAITLLYSKKYIGGTNIFRIYSLILLFKCTYFGIILNSIGKTKQIFYSSLLALLTNIILNYVLFLSIGFIGPAVSTLITTALVATFQLFLTSKILNIKLKNVFPWKSIFIISLINIGYGIVFHFIKNWIELEKLVGNEIESLILGVIWVTIYFISILSYIKTKWNSLDV